MENASNILKNSRKIVEIGWDQKPTPPKYLELMKISLEA